MGCKVNQAESHSLMERLSQVGYVIGSPQGADVIILNTCSVTARAEKEALSLLRRLRRQNPTAKLVAMGCLAQLSPRQLVGPDLANFAVSQSDKERLVSFLPNPKAPPTQVPQLRTRAFLKIQDGCSRSCAYCVVPLARGPSRSLPPEVALTQLSQILTSAKEVVLTGVHLGHYGLERGSNLGHFLAMIQREFGSAGGDFRIRLSSIEPLEAPLIYPALEYEWLAPHVHAPLQSGSDAILKRMGRPYARADYENMARSLRKIGPIALGTDVMVGFPGESAADFQATYDLLAQSPFSYCHVFPFSPRPGTLAATWERVPEEVKKERAAILKKLGEIKKTEFLATQYALKHLVLVENRLDAAGRPRVITGSYIKAVWAHPEKPAPNTLVWSRLTPPKAGEPSPEAWPW
jgi:threonylcarbamoyladenosine tRNA methylthiotransferase MtaB